MYTHTHIHTRYVAFFQFHTHTALPPPTHPEVTRDISNGQQSLREMGGTLALDGAEVKSGGVEAGGLLLGQQAWGPWCPEHSVDQA